MHVEDAPTVNHLRNPRRVAPIFALVLLTAAGVLARSFSAAPSSGESGGKSPPNFTARALLVRVVDAQTGQPVADAQVQNSTSGYQMQPGQETRPPDPRTGADGQVTIQLQIPPVEVRTQLNNFQLSISHTNYAPRTAQWFSDGGNVLDDVPSDYTIKVTRGISIGGRVQDDQGRPVAKAQIMVNAYGGGGYRTGTGEKKVQEYSYFSSYTEPGATNANAIFTNPEGRWEAANFPPEVENVSLVVTRDDGSDASYATSSENLGFGRRINLVAIGELRAGKGVFTLPGGFIARGRVLTQNGQPVRGATIIEATGMGNLQPRGRRVSDAEGRFEFPNRRTRQVIWAIEAPGYALASEVVTLKALISHKMESGQRKDADGKLIPRSIINRFTCDLNGVNVIDVTIEPAVSTNPYFEFDAKVDAAGEFTFTWYDDDGSTYTDKKPIAVA